jgi:hypothetical protein
MVMWSEMEHQKAMLNGTSIVSRLGKLAGELFVNQISNFITPILKSLMILAI